jgi:RNAse (barnase) inhibitor barstar
MAIATLNGAAIGDEAAFHAACQAELGFPSGYGATIDAWVDCLSYLGDECNMTKFRLKRNEVLEIVISDAAKLPADLLE